MAIKILIGGSPCTKWSIAQTKDRETTSSGEGWELFKNFVIAKEKFKPDFFLYENVKSMSNAIKEEITKHLGVEPYLINSALVSAQNRERYYWTNIENVPQPEDRGILLKDILEYGFDLIEGKSVNITANGGGMGGKTGLYAIPVNTTDNGDKARTLMAGYYKYGTATLITNAGFKGGTTAIAEPVGVSTPVEWDKNGILTKAVSCADGKTYTVYEVKDGQISIKGKHYPIKLSDGFYIIRKLTVTECCRLQTLPDDYCKAVSATQAYKGLGNGWTAEVIIHILRHTNIPLDEEIIVLSMYDGIGTGRYCFDKLGYKNIKYYAYEIDEYPIKVAISNYPDIIQCGDAFKVREDDWKELTLCHE